MPARTVLVEEEEKFFYCSKCENSHLSEGDFFTFKNDSEVYKTGFRPFCKECIKDLFWHYYNEYVNHENREVRISMALDRMCQILDIPFSFKVAEPAISGVKREAAEKNVPLDSLLLVPYTSKYMQLLNGAFRKSLGRETYEDSTQDRMNLYIEYFKIKSYINTAENEEIAGMEVDEDVPDFLLRGDYREDVKQKGTQLYYYLRQIVGNDYNLMNATFVETAILEYCNYINSVYGPSKDANATQISNIREKAFSAFKSALSELGIDPKSIRLEEDQNNVLGMKVKNLERTGPSDWYGHPDKVEKIRNIHSLYTDDNYNTKFTVRSIRNYFAGSADYAGLNYDDFNAVKEEEKEQVDLLIGNYDDILADDAEEDENVDTRRSEKE